MASAPAKTTDATTLAASSIGSAKSLPPLPPLVPLLLLPDPPGVPLEPPGRSVVVRVSR